MNHELIMIDFFWLYHTLECKLALYETTRWKRTSSIIEINVYFALFFFFGWRNSCLFVAIHLNFHGHDSWNVSSNHSWVHFWVIVGHSLDTTHLLPDCEWLTHLNNHYGQEPFIYFTTLSSRVRVYHRDTGANLSWHWERGEIPVNHRKTVILIHAYGQFWVTNHPNLCVFWCFWSTQTHTHTVLPYILTGSSKLFLSGKFLPHFIVV